jgi:hypothetical protein
MRLQERRWLKVPYKDKQLAKSKGAQWDALVKMWWVPMHVPLKTVRQWVIDANPKDSIT